MTEKLFLINFQNMFTFTDGIALYVSNGATPLIGSLVDAEYQFLLQSANIPQSSKDVFLKDIGVDDDSNCVVDILGKKCFLIRVFRTNSDFPDDESDFVPFSCDESQLTTFISSCMSSNAGMLHNH